MATPLPVSLDKCTVWAGVRTVSAEQLNTKMAALDRDTGFMVVLDDLAELNQVEGIS